MVKLVEVSLFFYQGRSAEMVKVREVGAAMAKRESPHQGEPLRRRDLQALVSKMK